MQAILKGLKAAQRRWLLFLTVLLLAVVSRQWIGALVMPALLCSLILAVFLVLPALLGALAGRIAGDVMLRLRRQFHFR